MEDLLIEAWLCIKNYVPAKDRMSAANSLLAAFVDNSTIDGDEIDRTALDEPLLAAVLNQFGVDDDEEEDEYGY